MESTNIQDGQTRSQESNSSALDGAQKDTIRKGVVETAQKYIAVPYAFGAEWTDYSQPPKALDCSELVEGVFHINKLNMPDGAQNQFDFTVPAGAPKPGDLGFFGKGGKVSQIYHVGIVVNEAVMIEARAHDPNASFETGEVILRPRVKWEKWHDFVGFRAHPKLA